MPSWRARKKYRSSGLYRRLQWGGYIQLVTTRMHYASCDPNVSSINFVTVRQEGSLSLSSSPRRLSIRFFSKALVGEHRALSYMSWP
jgi:hypothetical protein